MSRRNSHATIAFRVTGDLARRIDACREQKQLSRGQWCREAVSQATDRELHHQTEEDLAAIREQLSQAQSDVESLAELICRAVVVLLVKGADLEPQEANKLVKKHLKREEE